MFSQIYRKEFKTPNFVPMNDVIKIKKTIFAVRKM